MRRLFRSKSIDELLSSGSELHRTLKAHDLVLLGIGAIIGAGIFVITGQAAAQHAGPSIMLSFVLAAVACGLAALCYSELTSMIPISGSAYSYAYATMGELVAWIIGWDLVLEYALAASTVAIGWSGYFVSILEGWGLAFPKSMGASLLAESGGFINLPAALIVIALSYVLGIGIRESARANSIMVMIKLGVVVLFLMAGFGSVDTANWKPFMPFGWSGMLTGAGVIFFAYIGFDAVSTAGQEAINPNRDLPIGVIGSLAICTVLYLMVAAVLTGIVPYTELNVAAPIAKAIDHIGKGWLSPVIKVGALIGLTSVILVMLLGQSRVFYSMGRDGLLPDWASKVHPTYKTPFVSTWIVGSAVAFIAATTPLSVVGNLVSLGTLFAFAVVCGGVLVLRKTEPDLPRHFYCPAVPWVPVAGILVSAVLMLGLPLQTWILFMVWLGIGLVIYFSYGLHNSVLHQTPER